jgi:ubiquinone/menaquinone biosynthesis C-methylase UbiE
MNRRFTNMVRFVLDECIPPIIRDTKWFMYPFYWVGYRGKNLKTAIEFKQRVSKMSQKEYIDFYSNLDTISRNRKTDLNQECIDEILTAIPDKAIQIMDVGCGNGFLLQWIEKHRPLASLHGVDIKLPKNDSNTGSSIRYHQGEITKLPFEDRSFDIVICTHTLEHCTNLDAAIRELKRIARKQLIVVTPKQRPYLYTIDEHVQFFFYRELLTAPIGIENHRCLSLGGDWFYQGVIES